MKSSFIPDEFMCKNLQPLTKKKLIGWTARCIVHEEFTPEKIKEIRNAYPKAKILAHSECNPQVINEVDMMGSPSQMMDYVDKQMPKNTCSSQNVDYPIESEVKVKTRRSLEVAPCAPYMKKSCSKTS